MPNPSPKRAATASWVKPADPDNIQMTQPIDVAELMRRLDAVEEKTTKPARITKAPAPPPPAKTDLSWQASLVLIVALIVLSALAAWVVYLEVQIA